MTAGDDSKRIGAHKYIRYPKKGFELCDTIKQVYEELGQGGIFTRQCLEWCEAQFDDKSFDRIIVFSDSQDCDYYTKRTPKPFGKNNYIVDVSSNKHGINYDGLWTAEVSGWSEHFLTYIAAFEGVENKFSE